MNDFYVEAYDPGTMTPVKIDDVVLYDDKPMPLDEALWIASELNEGNYSPFSDAKVTWVVTDGDGERV